VPLFSFLKTQVYQSLFLAFDECILGLLIDEAFYQIQQLNNITKMFE
jgi:hypothetical protein